MSRKRTISQINNYNTFNMFKRQLLTLAENVYIYKYLPKYIDVAYMNKKLVQSGAIAFYFEEAVNSVIALPFEELGLKDIYGRPTKIQCINALGIRSKVLYPKDYVIMYDNYSKRPIWLDLEQYAERLALITRTMDINIAQQKTPRIIQVPQNLKKSIEDLTSDIDAGIETILTYDNLNIDSVNVLLTPAPLVVPELREEFNNLWSEALRIIGISNVSIQKKERLIRDEMSALNGGTIASRFSRWEPRKKAIEEINEKFADFLDKPIEVEFYDKTPDSENADNNDNLELDLTSVGGGQNVL